MPRHLFLTGQKHIGKSTLLQRLLEEVEGPIDGFYTERSVEVIPNRASVHMLSAATGRVPSEENLLFSCGISDPQAAERFEKLGTEALAELGSVMVMDELGPHEEHAEKFQKRVLELLDGETPVLGVLQQGNNSFLRRIAQHPQVRLVTVTGENRDMLAVSLRGWQKKTL